MPKQIILALIENKFQREYQKRLELNLPLDQPYEGLDRAVIFGKVYEFNLSENDIQIILNELLLEQKIKPTLPYDLPLERICYTSLSAHYPAQEK